MKVWCHNAGTAIHIQIFDFEMTDVRRVAKFVEMTDVRNRRVVKFIEMTNVRRVAKFVAETCSLLHRVHVSLALTKSQPFTTCQII